MIGNQEFKVNMAERLAGAASAALEEGKNLADGSRGIGPLGHLSSSDPTWSQAFFNGQSKWGESAGSMEHLLTFLQGELSEKTAQGLKDSIAGVMRQTEKMHGNQYYDADIIATAKANIDAAVAEIKGIKTKMGEEKAKAAEEVAAAMKTTKTATTDLKTTTVETSKTTKTGTAPEVEKQMQAGGSDMPDTI